VSAELPAYVTVTDAAGRVLFRRLATASEVEEAIQIARAADQEAENVLKRIAKDRDKILAAQAQRAKIDAASAPEIQVVEAGIVEAPDEEPLETKGHLPEYEGESDFPDFVERSAPMHDQPKLNKETDAFTAFGDDELGFLSALDEEKGK
jgi:hypothetical protein